MWGRGKIFPGLFLNINFVYNIIMFLRLSFLPSPLSQSIHHSEKMRGQQPDRKTKKKETNPSISDCCLVPYLHMKTTKRMIYNGKPNAEGHRPDLLKEPSCSPIMPRDALLSWGLRQKQRSSYVTAFFLLASRPPATPSHGFVVWCGRRVATRPPPLCVPACNITIHLFLFVCCLLPSPACCMIL